MSLVGVVSYPIQESGGWGVVDLLLFSTVLTIQY
jgi:hypothetical protein